MTHRWIPSTEERILRPFLDDLSPDLRTAVEADLARLLDAPDDPGFYWTWWRGRPESPRLTRSRIGILAARVAFRYVVLRDQPYIMAVNIVDLGEELQT